MVQQKPVGMHSECADGSKPYKIIFTITCEGETLYDAQKLASDVHVALRDHQISMKKGVTIVMTVEQNKVFEKDSRFDDPDLVYPPPMSIPGISTDNVTQSSWTGNCECKRTVHENRCALSNNT